MFDINIPHPKYPLNRYSTKQLMAWVEECALFIAICDKHYDDTGTYPDEAFDHYDTVQWTQWDIEYVLEKRGVKLWEINQWKNLARLDVMS